MNNLLALKLKRDELITTWQTFCELHSELYDLTCDEYQSLLSSDLERIEKTVAIKHEILQKITELDAYREKQINELNELGLQAEPITKVHQVMEIFKPLDNDNLLEKYNDLLVSIVEKIQDQNKRNQIYLNKAIHSLQDLRQSFMGEKNYQTYNSMGKTASRG